MLRHLAVWFLSASASAAQHLKRHATIRDQLTTLWDVKPALNSSDRLYAGLKPIADVRNIQVYNGRLEHRPYANHPVIYSYGQNVFVLHSTSAVDEDAMGQSVWMTYSHDNGSTWTPSREILFPAVRRNSLFRDKFKMESSEESFDYWCETERFQRAFQPISIIEYEERLYAIAQTVCFKCSAPQEKKTDTGMCTLKRSNGVVGAGRIARPLRYDGKFDGQPCWIEQNPWAERAGFHKTIYGSSLRMGYCGEAHAIREILKMPAHIPPWSDHIYNERVPAGTSNHNMSHVTHAVWYPEERQWQRFWSDFSYHNNTEALWAEYSYDGSDWYPLANILGDNYIAKTDIPDIGSKPYLFRIDDHDLTVLVHNPMINKDESRDPLTVATVRGRVIQPFNRAAVLRTNASTDIVPDTRTLKYKGFQYPSATRVGDNILFAYSENKENIWVSIVPIRSLP